MGRLFTLGLPGSDGIHLPGVSAMLPAPDKLRELLDAHITGAVCVDVLEEQLQVGVREHRRAQPTALSDRTPELILTATTPWVRVADRQGELGGQGEQNARSRARRCCRDRTA